MKLRQGFITHTYREQQLMVAAGPAARTFHGLVRSNETAAFIVDRLKAGTTEEGIVTAILEEYEVDRETAEQDVRRVLEQLWSIGAIEV